MTKPLHNNNAELEDEFQTQNLQSRIPNHASTDTSASLPSDYTFQTSDKRVHNFADAALNRLDSQSITATDIQNGSISGSQTAITVKPATLFNQKISVAEKVRCDGNRLDFFYFSLLIFVFICM